MDQRQSQLYSRKERRGPNNTLGSHLPTPHTSKAPTRARGGCQPSKNLVFGLHEDFRGRLIPQELPGVWGREARAEEASRRTCSEWSGIRTLRHLTDPSFLPTCCFMSGLRCHSVFSGVSQWQQTLYSVAGASLPCPWESPAAPLPSRPPEAHRVRLLGVRLCNGSRGGFLRKRHRCKASLL